MNNKALKLFGKQTLEEAGKFERLCHSKKRWYGNTVLVVLDACLDSTGLNYFTVVVPKVKKFYAEYILPGRIKTCKDFLDINKKELIRTFKNERVWNAMKEICKFIAESKHNKNEMKVLNEWAKDADPYKMDDDKIGSIKGIGLSTFQYLKIQGGVDSIMPDKIIIRWIKRNFSKNIKTRLECISIGEKIAEKLNLSRTELCWAIWIKESGELNKINVE